MTAGDVSDRVGHRHHRQPEGQCHAQQTDSHIGKRCRQDGTAAAAKNQPERAQEFRAVLPHCRSPYAVIYSCSRTHQISQARNFP